VEPTRGEVAEGARRQFRRIGEHSLQTLARNAVERDENDAPGGRNPRSSALRSRGRSASEKRRENEERETLNQESSRWREHEVPKS